MVDYQGPELFRGLLESMDVPIFDRISHIEYTFHDLAGVKLPPEDLVEMQSLRRISFTKKGHKPIQPTDQEAVKKIVPPCRLVKVESPTNKRVSVALKANAFACGNSQP